jgi:putative oxidoreductase
MANVFASLLMEDAAIAIVRPNQREYSMSSLETTLAERGNSSASTLLRVALGVMYLTHSIVLKVFTFGFAGTAGYFASLGLPSATAYLVIAAEVTGGVLLLANVATGWVSLALLPVLAGALWVHSGNGWVFSANGGGWEYPLFLIVVSVAVALQAFAARTVRRPALGSVAHPA